MSGWLTQLRERVVDGNSYKVGDLLVVTPPAGEPFAVRCTSVDPEVVFRFLGRPLASERPLVEKLKDHGEQ
jgi:hypothetical protein